MIDFGKLDLPSSDSRRNEGNTQWCLPSLGGSGMEWFPEMAVAEHKKRTIKPN